MKVIKILDTKRRRPGFIEVEVEIEYDSEEEQDEFRQLSKIHGSSRGAKNDGVSML
jgi:hypothetical protein